MRSSITTYSKINFFPLEPKDEDINILDIGHALSLLTRANGHFKHFYSVAQHSLNCYKEAKSRGYSERVQLACLLHDASESYLSDITRPVKHHLHKYLEIEDKLQTAIYAKYGLKDLTEDELKEVAMVDDTLLCHEFIELMDVKIQEITPEINIIADFKQRDFNEVEEEFISTCNKLAAISK